MDRNVYVRILWNVVLPFCTTVTMPHTGTRMRKMLGRKLRENRARREILIYAVAMR
jgi:hypothetical protein